VRGCESKQVRPEYSIQAANLLLFIVAVKSDTQQVVSPMKTANVAALLLEFPQLLLCEPMQNLLLTSEVIWLTMSSVRQLSSLEADKMALKDPNPGFARGIAKRSPIERMAWALKGAADLRKKDLKLNSMTAIAEGRKIRDRVSAMMQRAGADAEDARIYCVFTDAEAFAEVDPIADPELSALDVFYTPKLARLRVKNGPSDIKLAAAFVDKLPTGFLIFVWDRKHWAQNDPRKSVIWTIRPLIVENHLGTTTNAAAMRSEKRKIEDQLAKTAGFFPDDQD